jgi:hypothetical protein
MRGLTAMAVSGPTGSPALRRPGATRRCSADGGKTGRRHLGLGARAIRPRAPQRPILVTKEDAAKALGMSISHFQRHVQSEIKCVYSGQLSLYQWRDLERWSDDEATIGGRSVT